MDSDTGLESLMARYQQGDSTAVTALVNRLSPNCTAFSWLQFVSRRYADDLLQETWLRIHQVRHTYRPGEPVLPWLYAIARNIRVDHYRKAQRTETHHRSLEESPDIPQKLEHRSAGAPDLEALLAALPESQREVVAMLKVSGMSLEEVARATSSSVGSVKQKAHRAYENLRGRLSELGIRSAQRRTRMMDDDIDAALSEAAGASPEVDPALLDRISRSLGFLAAAGSSDAGILGLDRRPDSDLRGRGYNWRGSAGTTRDSAHERRGNRADLSGARNFDLAGSHGFGKRNDSGKPTAYARVGIAGGRQRGAGGGVRDSISRLPDRALCSPRRQCLTAGLLHAIPTVLAGWWILHRGFAVNTLAAALALGSLAGLAGVSMLELHCVNFEAPHAMLWHTAVLPLSGGIWALLAWGVRLLRNGRV